MAEGQGNITYGPSVGNGGIVVSGARNGLSIDADGYVVLGDDTGSATMPGKFLSNRRENLEGFYYILVGGDFSVSDVFVADTGSLFALNTSAAYTSPFLFTIDVSAAQNLDAIITINATDNGNHGWQLINCIITGHGEVFQVFGNGEVVCTDPDTDKFYAVINDTVISVPFGGIESTFGSTADLTVGGGTGTLADFRSSSTIADTAGGTSYIGFDWAPTLNRAGAGISRGIFLEPAITALAGALIAFENQTGDVYLCSNAAAPIGRGRVGVNGVTAPTAFFHLGAGNAAVSSAPMKFTSGVLQTAAEAGTVEYNGTNFFLTPNSAVRATALASIAISASVLNTVTNKIEVNIGGTVYYLLASTSPT